VNKGIFTLVASVAVVLSAQSPAQPQRPVFRSDAQFVLVDAYPVRDGRIAEGLTKADFHVLEDGVPQAVELFEFVDGGAPEPESSRRDPSSLSQSREAVADPRARAFVTFLDIPHVSAAGAHRARVPLVELLSRILAPADLFAVLSSDHDVSSMTFGRRVTAVDGMLARYWAWGQRDSALMRPDESGLWSCFAVEDPPSNKDRYVQDGARMRRLHTVLIERYREDIVLNRLEELVWHLGGLREGRTNVLLFSEGWRLFTRDTVLQAEVEDTGRAPVSIGTRGGRPEMFTSVAQGQRDACIMEGVRLAQLDSPARLRELVRLANAMNVAFFTVNPLGLVAGDQDPAERVFAADPTRAVAADDSARVAARRESLQTLAEATDGLAVVHSNDLRRALEPVIEQLRSFYLLGYYSTNTTFDGQMRAISVKTTQPGVTMRARRSYRAPSAAERAAAVSASSPATLEVTTLAKALDVLAGLRGADDRSSNLARYLTADAAPVLGVPQLFRTLPSPRAPVAATQTPAFRRTERLRVEWPIAQPLTARSVRVVNRAGQPMVVQSTVTERPEGDAVRLVVDVVIAPLAPGDYVVEVTVESAGETRRSLVAFRVVP
jgi:VWFA-related protein